MLIFKNFSYKFFITLFFLVISCSGQNCQDRGYNFKLGNKDLLVKNIFTKEKILEYMGYPTFTDNFSQKEKWIYREEKVCKFLFMPKKVTQDKTLILTFENDLMIDLLFYDNTKAKKNYLKIKTATTKIPRVNKAGWLQDIIGNIGKVSPF